jgi:hypothetical protein
MSVFRVRRLRRSLARRQSGRMLEDLLVLDLAGHDGSSDAFGLEGFDEAGELAEGEPVDVDVGVGCGSGVDVGVGLFVDGGDDYGEVMGACGVEEEEGEAAIASDQA